MNVPALNYLLRSKIYVHEDGQLRACHLVLGYQPLTRAFQPVGHAIRAGSPRLNRIDVSKPGCLARVDLKPVVLPGVRDPPPVVQPPPEDFEVAVPAEEEAESSRLSLEEEIDEFYFEEEVDKAPVVELSDPKGEQDRNSVAGGPIIITCSDDSSDGEVGDMGKSLRELMSSRGKGQSSKASAKAQAQDPPPTAP